MLGKMVQGRGTEASCGLVGEEMNPALIQLLSSQQKIAGQIQTLKFISLTELQQQLVISHLLILYYVSPLAYYHLLIPARSYVIPSLLISYYYETYYFMKRSSYQTIEVKSISDHIVHAAFNRPAKMNAMSSQFFSDLAAFFNAVNEDPEVRVVILTGNGKAFCAGLDLKEYGSVFNFDQGQDPSRMAIKIRGILKKMQDQIASILDCKVPVLAGIHGLCIGGGIDMTSMCDIRYCTEDSKFTIKEIDIGMAADIGTLQLFPVITGNSSFFRQIAYTGRFFDAKQAFTSGFVSRILKDKDQLLTKLTEVATEIASKSPVGIWTIKNVLRRQIKKDFVDNFDHMAVLNSAMLQNSDMKVAIMSTMMKQKPQFPKL